MRNRTELHKRKFGRRDTQKEKTEKKKDKNNELKIGVWGTALDKGKRMHGKVGKTKDVRNNKAK